MTWLQTPSARAILSRLTVGERRNLASLTPAARRLPIQMLVQQHEYERTMARLKTNNCFVMPAHVEVSHSRRLEAELPALMAAVEAELAADAEKVAA